VENGNRDALMTVMSYIRNVRKRMPEISSLFDPMQNIVALLKTHAISIDLPNIGGQPALSFLDYSKMMWDNAVNKAFRVKETIQPLQMSMVEGIKKEVKTFHTNVNKFMKEFRATGPFSWMESSRLKDAYVSLDHCQLQLQQLLKESKAINDLEDLFELPLSAHDSIHETEQDLKSLKVRISTVISTVRVNLTYLLNFGFHY
jgi:hypothetical protein